MYTELDVTPAR